MSSTSDLVQSPRVSWLASMGPSRRYLVLLVALAVVDALQTTRMVQLFGTNVEANPLMRWVMDEFSAAALWWVKGLAVLVVALLLSRVRPGVLLAVVLVQASVVLSNMLQMIVVPLG